MLRPFAFRLPALLLPLLLLHSCRENGGDEGQSVFEIRDYTLAETAYRDLWTLTDMAAKSTPGIRGILDCATLTQDTTANPRKLEINFGESNCTGTDGRTRRGKITASFTAPYSDSLCQVAISPQGYYFNNYRIEGNLSLTYHGRNAQGNSHYTLSVQNGKVTPPENGDAHLTWNASRRIEWISGDSTTTPDDDQFAVSGTLHGTSLKGSVFNASVLAPFTWDHSCAWFSKGVVSISPVNQSVRLLNFGDGSCASSYTVTIEQSVFQETQP